MATGAYGEYLHPHSGVAHVKTSLVMQLRLRVALLYDNLRSTVPTSKSIAIDREFDLRARA